MRGISETELRDILAKHDAWLCSKQGGMRANLSWASLSEANLSGASLSRANLSRANLSGANLSGANHLLSASSWMASTFRKDERGYIVYRAQSGYYQAPSHWRFKPGAFLTEVPNPTRTTNCGSGVNFATKKWIKNHCDGPIWKCRIRWKDLPDVCVPYGTDGKARCGRLELIGVVK